MKKRTEIQVTSLLGALFLGLLRLPRRVLWDWPKAASARLWRTVLDRPIYGSFLLSLFAVIPLGVGILAMQADKGRFGSRLPAIWAACDLNPNVDYAGDGGINNDEDEACAGFP